MDIIATYFNRNITEFPKDLYIPPAALKVFLELFEGPLDLLLYLIRKQNIEILEIPIHEITSQYIQYINTMQSLNIELASEYLLMAALLIEIKSKMLLPQKIANLESEELNDPRADLIKQLLEYDRIKKASENLAKMPQANVDFKWIQTQVDSQPDELIYTTQKEIFNIMRKILVRNIQQNKTEIIKKQSISIREYMKNILKHIRDNKQVSFEDILTNLGRNTTIIIVTFIAILELIKDNEITFTLNDQQILLKSYE